MTSMLSKDDLEDELVHAGIISPVIRQKLLVKIEQYARKYPLPLEKHEYDDILPLFRPSSPPADPRYEYKCPTCKQKKRISEFPERKRENRRSPVSCLACKPEA